MADNVLKEFLVAIGFKADEAQLKKVDETLARVTKTVIAFEAAFAAAAVAVVAATTKMAGSFEDLYYASQRTKASVQNIQALGYAVSQLGGSYAGALGSLEAFGKNLRTNPGYESMVRQLGVATSQNGKLRDTVDILADLGKVFGKQSYSVAYQYATALGLDEATFRALRDQPEALKKYREEYERTARTMGLNAKEAAERSKELDQSLRSMWLTVTIAAQKILTDLTPALTALIDSLRDWIKANPDKIEAFFHSLADMIGAITRAAQEWQKEGGFLTILKDTTVTIERLVKAFSSLPGFANALGSYSVLPGYSNSIGSSSGGTGGGGVISRAWGATKRLFGVGGASAAEGPAGPAGAGAGAGHIASKAERASFIRQEAVKRGIDPDIALRVAQSEGFNVYAGDKDGTGTHTSFGDYQLHYAGRGGGMSSSGLGDAFTRATGLDARDPSTWREQTRFALDQAAKGGWAPWHGWKGPARAGLDGAKPMGWQLTEEERKAGPTSQTRPSDHMVFGDSIAAGLIGASGGKLAGKGVERITSDQILANIKGYPSDQLKGKFVYLASGSNSPNQLDAIRQSITYLRGAGVRGVTLLGAGDAPQIAGLNNNLQGLAKEMGVGFNGLGALSGDRVHPKDYNALGRSLTRVPELAPESLTPASNDNSKNVTLTQKTEINVTGGGDPVATANQVAHAQGGVNAMSMRNAQSAVR